MNLTKTQQRRKKLAELEVENWNLKHAIGTRVKLYKDSGDCVETTTRSEAQVSGSGHAVCWFEGISGYYLLSRAEAL